MTAGVRGRGLALHRNPGARRRAHTTGAGPPLHQPRSRPRSCSTIRVWLPRAPPGNNLVVMPIPAPKPTSQLVAAPPRREAKPPGPCTMVIFGAGGDLTKRLLVPALYNLAAPACCRSTSRSSASMSREQDTAKWRDSLHAMLQSFVGNASQRKPHRRDRSPPPGSAWPMRCPTCRATSTIPTCIEKLHAHCTTWRSSGRPQGNVSVLPRGRRPLLRPDHRAPRPCRPGRRATADDKPQRWRRVVIEKPFGHDLEFGEGTEHPHPARAA